MIRLVIPSLFLTIILFMPVVFAETEGNSAGQLKILMSPLNSLEKRADAMNQLIGSASGLELETALINILSSQKESIAMRNVAADGLKKLNTKSALSKLKRILFDQYESDALLRQTSFLILWETLTQDEKKELLPQLVRMAQNTSELAQLRMFVIGHLAQSRPAPEGGSVWVEKIIRSRSEPAQVRTGGLSYLERNQLEKLEIILPDIIKNSSDDPNFRQIALLQLKRLFPSLVSPIAQSILASQNENIELRKLCLNILQDENGLIELLPFFKLVMQKESNPEIRRSLETLIASMDKR